MKVAALTPATRKTLATIGALWVSFAVTASANASPALAATPASMPPKMVTVTPASGDLSERGRDPTSRPDTRVPDRRATKSSTEPTSMSEDQGVVFVSNGKRRDVPQSPTPESRSMKDDATAIIAYLMLLSK